MSSDCENELKKLKLKIKTWEKEFFVRSNRKPDRNDVDSNDIKEDYKKYWKLSQRKNLNQVWGKQFNKSHDNKSSKTRVGSLQSFSKKLMQKFLDQEMNGENQESFVSHSLKKTLRQKSLDNNKSNTHSESTPANNRILSRAQSVDETALKSIQLNENFNSFMNNSNENRFSEADVFKNSNSNLSEPILSETILSDSASFLSFTDHENQFAANNKRKSDVFDFDDNNYWTPTKRRSTINSIIDSIKDDELQNMTDAQDPFDDAENDAYANPLKDIPEKKERKFFKSGERNTRIQSRIVFNDCLDEDSFQSKRNKKKPNNFFKSREKNISVQKENHCNQEKNNCAQKENDLNQEKNIHENQGETNESLLPTTSQAKAKSGSKQKKSVRTKANFKRLNLKKKVFASRGYKKFNIRKYKRGKWKNMQKSKSDECYKCGQSGHWASSCTFDDIIDADDDVFEDELKELGVSNTVEDILKGTVDVTPFQDNEALDAKMLAGLREMGHESFRENQEKTIKRILLGKSTLMISSTGSGKSLCYQLAAYLYWKHKKAITLVISPLISLMEDQLTSFPKCMDAVCVHSGLTQAQKENAVSRLLNGEAQVVLMSPEAVSGGSTCINFNALPKIAFVCIDEAHCLSEWSNNFRPSYLQLYRVLKEKMGLKTFLALTATATKYTASTLCRTLHIDSNNDIIGTTLVPDNLILSVSVDVNKDLAMIDLLKSQRFKDFNSIIIYCTRREETERLASFIRISMQDIKEDTKDGKQRLVWEAQPYHAGMTSEQRARVQKRFIRGHLRVVVATIAFGMGINKSNVRAIIHYNLPKSFENYMQEIGRAGRDGLEAHCHLFLDSDGKDLFELQRHIYGNSTDRKCIRKLLQKVFKSCRCKQVLREVDENADNHLNSDERVCPGHEVAFPIQETVLELDMREENILTLLTFLELNYNKAEVKLLPPINSMCTILCYGDGSEQMKRIARICPPVAIALTLHQKKSGSNETPNKIKFSLVDVCSMLGLQFSEARRQLRSLEWEQINGRPKRTNVRVAFSDPSFHVKAPGDLTEQELDQVLECMYSYTNNQEIVEINRLQNVYDTFKYFSMKHCVSRINPLKCNQLKDKINKYFNDETPDETRDETQDFSLNPAHNNLSAAKTLASSRVFDLDQARRDVRDMLSIHGDQQLNSARVIARILQGIGSPRYPAEVWGKVRRFWRSNVYINFNQLMSIANEELIRIKSLS